MTAAAVNRLEPGHDTEKGDCGIISLSVLLGIPYTEMLRAATLTDPNCGRDGLHVATMKRMAAGFGYTLIRRNPFDWDDDYGLIITCNHAAVLRNGLVLDRTTVWEWSDWVADQTPRPKRKSKKKRPAKLWTALYVVKE